MATETTIPLLPCVSLDETLDFYRALGFEVTYQQARPNPYAVMRRGGFELHFFGLKGLEPASAYSTCLVAVPEVEPLHQTFSEALQRKLGRLPVAGIPRLTRMKPGQGRFTLVDLSGNSVIFVKKEPGAGKHDASPPEPGARSPLAKALAAAARLRDFKMDDAAAAKVLDVALARNEPSDPVERARALAARAELAVTLGDEAHARALRAEFEGLPLPAATWARLRDELRAADDLERVLGQRDFVEVRGARENNLKNVSLRIPRRKLTVFTGGSGSTGSSIGRSRSTRAPSSTRTSRWASCTGSCTPTPAA